jgi:hypothetical protein
VLFSAAVVGLNVGPGTAVGKPGNGWQPGPGATLDNTYDGAIDTPPGGILLPRGRSIRVSGWAVDTTAQGWAGVDDIHIYEGLAGNGGTMLAKAAVAQSRPDVGEVLGNPFWSASGYQAMVDGKRFNDGPHMLTVYAHTPHKGWWARQVSFTITSDGGGVKMPMPMQRQLGGNGMRPIVVITSPTFGGRMYTGISTESKALITGYALDPDSPAGSGVQNSGILRVEIWLNGTFHGEADMGYSDPRAASHGARFQNSGFRYAVQATKLPRGDNQLEVRAQSVAGAVETFVQTTFVTVEGAAP